MRHDKLILSWDTIWDTVWDTWDIWDFYWFLRIFKFWCDSNIYWDIISRFWVETQLGTNSWTIAIVRTFSGLFSVQTVCVPDYVPNDCHDRFSALKVLKCFVNDLKFSHGHGLKSIFSLVVFLTPYCAFRVRKRSYFTASL